MLSTDQSASSHTWAQIHAMYWLTSPASNLQLVEKQGVGARVEKADALSVSRIFSLDTKDVALVCICYVENATAAQIQYAIQRMRRKAAQAIILVALIGNTNNLRMF